MQHVRLHFAPTPQLPDENVEADGKEIKETDDDSSTGNATKVPNGSIPPDNQAEFKMALKVNYLSLLEQADFSAIYA